MSRLSKAIVTALPGGWDNQNRSRVPLHLSQLISHSHTNIQCHATTWRRYLFEQLMVAGLVKKFPSLFYGVRSSLLMFCTPQAYEPTTVWYSDGLLRHARRRKGAKKLLTKMACKWHQYNRCHTSYCIDIIISTFLLIS